MEELKTDFKDSGRILGHYFCFIEAWQPISRQSAAGAGTLSLNKVLSLKTFATLLC